LSTNPPTKDGAIDVEAFKVKITESVQSELDYLTKSTGTAFVSGMGSQGEIGEQPKPLEESRKSIQSALGRLGLSEKAAETGAAGRSN
jgi:hypothetical protein